MAFTNWNAGILPMQGREMLNTATFGGNTGQQGIFDPNDEDTRNEAIQRLRALHEQYGPMLRQGYTGETGFAPNDADSYYKWQNAVTEGDNIMRSFGGRDPMSFRSGGPVKSEAQDALAMAMGEQRVRNRGLAQQRGQSAALQSLEDLETGKSLRYGNG